MAAPMLAVAAMTFPQIVHSYHNRGNTFLSRGQGEIKDCNQRGEGGPPRMAAKAGADSRKRRQMMMKKAMIKL
jgi:hypothetical protein